MSPWTSDVPRNDGKSDPDVSQLILLLEQISDIELVVKCCLKAIPPNILQTRELLTYGRKRIFDQGQNCPQLQTLVCNRIQLLDTFEIINEDLHPENWLKFTKLDLLQVSFEYLQNNDLGCTAIVWLRHGSELLPKLPADDIITMLDMIPTSSDTAPMLSFLSAFLPAILSRMPYMLSDIITWLHNKTRTLTCIVLVLRAAPVPWSDKLVQLVEEFGNCGHHRTAEIKQEMNTLVVKLVLKKYQMSEMFNSITSNTMMYEQLVRYILKHGNSDSLEDALKVVHSNPSHIGSVHSIYLEQLLKA
ncbi:hypothetical protein B566_EDAN013566, partial [Ephemera danica]